MEARWHALEPADAARILTATRVPWWLAGGWALDHFLGRRTRPHADLDLGVWRDDFARLSAELANWEVHQMRAGELTRLAPGEPLAPNAHAAWVRRAAESWAFEILVEERTGSVWTYRRDARVRRPAAEIVVARGGLPVIRPEVQLLYKAKVVRPKDQADFDHVVPALDADARAWLAAALEQADPAHAWTARLR